jgi:stress-induced morphogen
MIHNDEMIGLIRRAMPDAEVQIADLTGTRDHFDVLVRSKAFAGVTLLDRHRMVEKALAEARADGRIHAMSIRTEVLEQR